MLDRIRNDDPFYAQAKIRRFTPQRAFDPKRVLVLTTAQGGDPILAVVPVGRGSAEVLEEINSMVRDRVYARAERVASGVLALRDGGFHSTRGGGASFGTGSLSLIAEEGKTAEATDEEAGRDTAAWLVVARDGRRALAVFPRHLDSFQVVDLVAPTQRGGFYVEMVVSGTLFAREGLAAPGSVLRTDVGEALDVAPVRAPSP